jgi:outer membrane protein assembly factor BamB
VQYGFRFTFYIFLSYILIPPIGQSQASSDDWLSFRGNPQLTGVATGELPENLELLWTFETGDGIESTAAIAAGTVYVGTLDGYLYAINLENGGLKWKYQASGEIKSSPTVFRNVVHFGDGMGVFHAVDAQTGEPIWTFEAEAEIISSANVAQDRLLFGSYDQYLYCLSAEDGSLAWKFETEGYVHGTPAIVNGAVVISGCDGYLRSINIADGVEQQKIALGDYVAASPVILNGRAYAGTFGNQVLCAELENSEILWWYEHPERRFPFYASAAVTDDIVVIGGRDKIVHTLKSQTGEPLWTYPAKSRVDSSPVIVGERVFFGTVGGELVALNLDSGEKVWEFVIGAAIIASPSVVTGKLVIGADDGRIYCFGERGIDYE